MFVGSHHSPNFPFRVATSDLSTSIINAIFEICLVCCAMTPFKLLISRSNPSVEDSPIVTAGVVGVATPSGPTLFLGAEGKGSSG